jgi:hypothetical protein
MIDTAPVAQSEDHQVGRSSKIERRGVAAFSFIVLLLATLRDLGIFDEGIVLTGPTGRINGANRCDVAPFSLSFSAVSARPA